MSVHKGRKRKLEALDRFMRRHLHDVSSDRVDAMTLVETCLCAACELYRTVTDVDAENPGNHHGASDATKR